MATTLTPERLQDPGTGEFESDASAAARQDLAFLQRVSRANQLAVARAERGWGAHDLSPTPFQEDLRAGYESLSRSYDRVSLRGQAGRDVERLDVDGVQAAVEYAAEDAQSGGRVPARRRWHAHPMFDTRVYEERVRHTFYEGRGTTREIPGGSARSPLSVASERERVLAHPIPRRGPLQLTGWSGTPVLSWGGSTASTAELGALQAGHYDARNEAFSSATVAAGVDTKMLEVFNLTAEAELMQDRVTEDATYRWQAMEAWAADPNNVVAAQLGKFLIPFGIENMRDPIDRFFLDTPFVRTRLMGPVGLFSDLGAAVAFQPRGTRLRFHAGAVNAFSDGLTPDNAKMGMESFLAAKTPEGRARFEQRSGGRPWVDMRDDVFSRVMAFGRAQADLSARGCRGGRRRAFLGGSTAFGPNATGNDGSTLLAGVDAYLDGRWRPLPPNVGAKDYQPDWIWQTELLYRRFEADALFEANGAGPADDVFLASDVLHDWGGYTQALYALSSSFALGVRGDYGSASGDSVARKGAGKPFVVVPRSRDPFRSDRWRLSGLLIWSPTDEIRLRLQYSYEQADHLSEPVHSVWVSFDGLWAARVK
jgi:hypothetical protein